MPRLPLKTLRARATPSVRLFPRFVPEAQVPAWFRRADLVVLPYREIDQSGVLFTALAFGKPLLLTSVGGFPEVAESGAAELVVPGDPSALHIALRRLLDDPGRREALAAAARERGGHRLLVGPDRRPAPRALRIAFSATIPGRDRAGDRLLGLRRAARLRAARLRPAARRARRGCAAAGAPRPSPASHRRRVADRRRLRRGGAVIGAKVANRARSTTRATARGDRRLRRLDRRHAGAARARPAPTSCSKLPRGGKVRAQDAAVERAHGDVVAFSDANATWEPDALRALVAPVRRPARRLRLRPGALRQRRRARTRRALYWRYEMWLRALESRLASVTGGNGAIYATRREAYIEVDPIMGHDLSLPVQHGQARLARGLRAGGARDREDGARRSRASSPASGG